MKILNIYGQEYWHTEARIIGNVEGLEELKRAIGLAIKTSQARTSNDNPLFASDGEGYEVIVECHNDAWGLAGGNASYWNNPQVKPYYTAPAKRACREAIAAKNKRGQHD